MEKQFARYRGTDQNTQITPERDGPFLRELARGLLMGLKELGYLNEAQLGHGEERLGYHDTEERH